jgi:hypothetical protein
MQVPCPLPWMKGCLALSSSGVFLLCPGMNKESCVGFFFFSVKSQVSVMLLSLTGQAQNLIHELHPTTNLLHCSQGGRN